jgi:hypothetical protein
VERLGRERDDGERDVRLQLTPNRDRYVRAGQRDAERREALSWRSLLHNGDGERARRPMAAGQLDHIHDTVLADEQDR